MKINENTAVYTPKILLVPYSKHHVPRYHEWMQNEDLRKATASELLTLDEEYSMQRSWREDTDKLTFIACLPPAFAPNASLKAQEHDGPDRMIGDVNLFLRDYEDEDEEGEGKDEEMDTEDINEGQADADEDMDDDTEPETDDDIEILDDTNDTPKTLIGELELMIASPTHRGQHLGLNVLLTFLYYTFTNLLPLLSEYSPSSPSTSLQYLRVKIDKDNTPSIKLFEKVGFVRTKREPNYFGEVELRLGFEGKDDEEMAEWVRKMLEGVSGVKEPNTLVYT
ncbi:hypothetical protein K402DRAFT_411964 [Aulographum hederae CBS 113979]|uniref:N-acetyltransferase domain-containing protein n=1 Tax=Aulographum hederae CBS 113979 TaxID=1176131 RepID=A0A6G1H3X6_9PEZI|nr:hypothetical protein K402DRAFT_411964 [Aulographum hederae CBS 113979]